MKTTYSGNQFLDYHAGRSTPPAITPYLGLLTAVETPTEPSGSGYGRVPIGSAQFGSAAASYLISNTAAITFAQATGSWGDIIGFGIWDAVTSGNLLRKTYAVSGLWRTFTALASNDELNCPGHGLANNDRAVVIALPGNILPTGLTQGTLYHVISAADPIFELSTSQGGAAVNITANGAGRVAKVVATTVGSGAIASFAIGTITFSDY